MKHNITILRLLKLLPKLLILGVLLCGVITVDAQITYPYNFTFEGNPLARNHGASDPDVHVYDGTVWMYTSKDHAPGYAAMDGYHAWSSTDMINWTDHGEVFNRAKMNNSLWGSTPLGYMWAPGAARKQQNGVWTYYLYYPHNTSFTGEVWVTGVATAPNPWGPYTDQGPVKGPNNSGIDMDPMVFLDDDGQFYIYGNTLRVAKLNPDMVTLAQEPKWIGYSQAPPAGKGFGEGSYMHKRNGVYYYSWSNDGGHYATATNPYGPFTWGGTIVTSPVGAQDHHSVFDFNGQWYYFYHIATPEYPVIRDGQSRIACFDKLYYNPDGTIKPVIRTLGSTSPVTAFKANSGGSGFTSNDGTVYSADMNFSGGGTYSSTSAIAGTTDDILYQSERNGNFSYNIPMTNGSYEVTLKFAEIYHTTAGSRLFNVTIEGSQVLTNLDIWSMVGKDAAYDRTFTINVTDGHLNIVFSSIKDNAKISAINIKQVGVTPVLPTSVSVSPTTLTLTAIGNTGQLTPTVLPTNADNKTVTWSVNPAGIVTVSNGLVTAVAAGSATVTATTVNGLTATCAVTVAIGSINAFTQIEAETYSSMLGVQAEACTEGGQNIGWIENGDYIVFNNVDFGTGATSFDARVASGTSGGSIEVRLDGLTGTLVGTCAVTGTGGWSTWITKSCAISGASGTHNLYLKFTGGTGYLFNLNWLKFTASSLPNVTALTGWVSGTTNNKVSGSNRLMTVMVMGESNVNFSATGVTYGGQAMTKQTEKLYYVAGNRTYASIFTLKEAGVNAATNGAIAVSWSPTPSVGSSIYSVLLGNVDQPTPVGVTANNGLTGTTVTTTALSAASGDMVITAGATENDGSITFNNGFTEAFETSGLAWGDACGGYKMGSGTNETPSFTQSASMRLALCAIVAKKSLSGLKSASIVSSASIDKSAGNIVNVYPNPVSKTLYVNHGDAQNETNIKIFNLQGQLLYNKQASGSITAVDVNELRISGLILVQVSSGQNISTFKVSVAK